MTSALGLLNGAPAICSWEVPTPRAVLALLASSGGITSIRDDPLEGNETISRRSEVLCMWIVRDSDLECMI